MGRQLCQQAAKGHIFPHTRPTDRAGRCVPTPPLMRRPCQLVVHHTRGSEVYILRPRPRQPVQNTGAAQTITHETAASFIMRLLLCGPCFAWQENARGAVTHQMLHFGWHSIVHKQGFLLLIIIGKTHELHRQVTMIIPGSRQGQDLGYRSGCTERGQALSGLWAMVTTPLLALLAFEGQELKVLSRRH